MPANAHTSKNFTCMCFEKSKVASAEYKKEKLYLQQSELIGHHFGKSKK